MKTVILAATVAVLVMGCGDATPKCDDSEVTESALSVATTVIMKQEIYQKMYKMTTASMRTRVAQYEMDRYNPTDDDIEKKIEEYDLEIINIRTSNIDEAIQKITCSAQIKSGNGQTHNFDYTAQQTEDGNLFVEGSF